MSCMSVSVCVKDEQDEHDDTECDGDASSDETALNESEKCEDDIMDVPSSSLLNVAIKNFVEIAGRQPTSLEIREMSFKLSSQSFLDAHFDENEIDSDYSPQVSSSSST